MRSIEYSMLLSSIERKGTLESGEWLVDTTSKVCILRENGILVRYLKKMV